MQLLPLQTGILRPDDDLVAALLHAEKLENGDLIILSSKVVATVEDAFIDLSSLEPRADAYVWSEKIGRTPAFCEAVLLETARLHGSVVGHCPGALLTEVRPEELSTGTILTANAGLDQSNAPEGTAIGWPKDPVKSVVALKQALEEHVKAQMIQGTQKTNIALILTDSCCRPRRLGVTAFALVVAGIDPLESQSGNEDLFGRPLRITTEATADQLATAGNFLMGNAGQATPAVIIRDHGLSLSEFTGWVPGIEPEEDLFKGIL